MQNIDAGDVDIVGDEITLIDYNQTRSLNIINHVVGFDIYESLENNTLQADFHISEGIELMNLFPIVGEEWIQIAIRTPTRKTNTYKFFVQKILNVRTNNNNTMKSYTLQCVTEDYLRNASILFSKRYKDLSYQDAVRQLIMSDLGSTKSLEVEKTKGKFDYVVNRVRPFQVIDLLTERAVSSDKKSSFFLFYEDNEAYRFTTIERLIETRMAKAETFTFFYDNTNLASPIEKVINVRNILSYQVIEQGSAVDKVRRGSIRNQFREFDVYRGAYWQKQEYVNSSDHKSFVGVDGSSDMNSSGYNRDQSRMPAISRMMVKDGTRPEMEHNKNLPYKRAYKDRFMQQGLRIRVYGDTNLFVGDVVKIEMPEISGTTVRTKEQELHTGNYIVREIKHSCFQKDTSRYEHFMILDLRKPNLKKEI